MNHHAEMPNAATRRRTTVGDPRGPRAAWARRSAVVLAMAVILLAPAAAKAVQIQSMIRIKGNESSKLVGMGLVVGLNGTGDGDEFAPAIRPLAAMTQRLLDPNVVAGEVSNAQNVAVVSITAKLPAHGVREGDTVDLQVASVGAADSLRGGRLFMTPLYGPVPGSPVYAFAEGAVVMEDEDTPTVGSVENGATMTRDVLAANMDQHGRITLVIDDANATWPMANTLATMINDVMAPDGPPVAAAADQKNIVIQIPAAEQANPASFIAQVLEIELDPSLIRTEARVVINERTATIVMTGDVQISPVAISHEGLTITTLTPPRQPTPEQPDIEDQRFIGIDPAERGGARMADLLAAFNQLKVPAEDRIAIIKQMHSAGQLHAKLIIKD